jgi:hypothetical protein
LIEAARINPEKVALLRSAADVVSTPAGLVDSVRSALSAPERLSGARRQVASEMFHDPGTATVRAVALVQELLGPSAAIDERSQNVQRVGEVSHTRFSQ